MTPPRNPRRTTTWITLRKKRLAIGRASQEACCRCHNPVDYSVNGNHRNGPTVDHLDPIATGGDPYPPLDQLGIAHRHCNSRHGQRISNARQGLGPGSRGGNPDTYTKRSGKRKGKTGSNNANGRAASSLAESITPRKGASVVSDHGSAQLSTIGAAADISTPFTEDLRNPGEFDALPLIFPPPHPDAVGSHGDAFVAAAEERMRADRWTRGDAFRWWQWLVAQRLLEYRADGSWCHPLSLVSVPRQQGKTELLDELAIWRASCGEASGVPHEVGHSASTVVISRLTQSSRWQWALDAGLSVARQLGDSQIKWPDGSVWRTMAPGNMFGRSLGTILGDEAWSWSAEDFWQATYPTVAERPDALVVLFSAAHDAPKSLLGTLLGNPMVCVMLWGAPAGADDADVAVWRAATPFWSENRERVMRMAAGESSFASQFLNRWPEVGASAGPPAVSEGEWSAAGRPGLEVQAKRCVVGISKEADDRWPVVVAGRTADGAVAVRLVGVYATLPDAQEAAAGAAGAGPWLVAPAFPLKGQVELRRAVKTFWLSDTELSAAVAMCGVRLRSGELVHDRDAALSAAVLAVPLRLPRGECGAGVLAMAAAAFAFRPRGTSAVA